MSTRRSVPLWVNSDTVPSAPTGTVTRFGIVWPARSTFRFDEVGSGSPVGKTVTKPAAVASVAVTFSTTADTSRGTPATPHTGTVVVDPAPGLTPDVRVSRMRVGVIGTYWVAAGYLTTFGGP